MKKSGLARFDRRRLLHGLTAGFCVMALPAFALALPVNSLDGPAARIRFSSTESSALRAWIVRIAEAQVTSGPTPKWTQR
ncbi:MAG: hypothetical protein LBH14_04645, partial [Desulfobulbaceae bacterium]|nr:hypothetical protein [Desulfobulbaceae bacterium]